jgi:regulator of protease activity HflC (stomatin/prohibitin superfamily)
MKKTHSILIAIISVLGIIVIFAVYPLYNVWQQGLAGKAALERAEQERMILVEQARAEKDSASMRAEAIQIMGKAAKDYPEYRYQEFLGAFAEALQNGDIDKLVFVPTEAQIPITEATRTVEE